MEINGTYRLDWNDACDHRLLLAKIHHLWAEKCAWGISITTWIMWLCASALLLIYALLREEILFVIVQIINIIAITATIALAKRSNNICPYHLENGTQIRSKR